MSKLIAQQHMVRPSARLVIVVLLIALGLSMTPTITHAVGGTVADEASCTAIGGTWFVDTSSCVVVTLDIASGEVLQLFPPAPATLTLIVNGTLNNNGELQIIPSATLIVNGTVNNNGTLSNLGTFIDNSVGAAINNGSTGVINNDGTLNNAGVLNNGGVINNNPTGTINNNGPIDNNKTIINNGSINNNFFGGTINNNAGSNFTNNGTLTNDGVINNNAGGTITNAGAIVNTNTINGKCGAFNGFPAAVTVVDQCVPTVSIASPSSNAVYLLNQLIAANYSCSDEPRGSGISTCTGPVPSGSNISTSATGTLAFAVTATDVAGNTTTGNQTYTVIIGRDYLQSIRNNVAALRATITKNSDVRKLDTAIAFLDGALNPALWRDSNHPAVNGGSRVFAGAREAAEAFEELLKESKSTVPRAALQTFGGQLVTLARALAVLTISEAIQVNGDAKAINTAQNQLAKGDSNFAAGKNPQAIDNYSTAWDNAVKSSRLLRAAEGDSTLDHELPIDDTVLLPFVTN